VLRAPDAEGRETAFQGLVADLKLAGEAAARSPAA
jgi:hypothetical protein